MVGTVVGIPQSPRQSLKDVQRQHRLFAENDTLRVVLNSVPIPSTVLNTMQQIVFGNSAVLQLAGVASEDTLLSRRLGEALHCVHADSAVAACGCTEFCSSCGAAQAISSAVAGEGGAKEWRMTRYGAGGQKEALELMVSVHPIMVAGEPFLNCSMVDISHERRRRILERTFFHDLLNSAVGLTLCVDAIQESASPRAVAESASLLRSCSAQMVSEIQSQESLLAVESGEFKIDPSWFSTLDLLTQFSEQYQWQFLQRGCSLVIAAEAADISICSDHILLGRVLGNMLKNALEASTAGGTVTLGSRVVNRDFEIWVNNPQLVPPEIQPQVFQRSFSTKGAGRGLGCYSMRLLSERYLHGTVRFISDRVSGTSFIGRYPIELGQ